MSAKPAPASPALQQTQRWLERAVIGLNLCPFAKAVHTKGQIRWVECEATSPVAVLQLLVQELQHLAAADAAQVDTTLIVAPQLLPRFADFNDFLGVADDALADPSSRCTSSAEMPSIVRPISASSTCQARGLANIGARSRAP